MNPIERAMLYGLWAGVMVFSLTVALPDFLGFGPLWGLFALLKGTQ